MEAVSQELNKTAGFRERLAAYAELTKPRIAFMLVLTAAAGFYLGTTADFSWTLFVHSMVGITLLAFGVATLNQYLERDTDALMERTSRRPLPSNKLGHIEALVFGLAQCALAEGYLFFLVNHLTAFLGLTVIAGYVLLYTPLKRRTTACTAIGAIPGAMPPLMGWTAAAGIIDIGALLVFGILFFWQFPHFLAIAVMYKDEYAKAGIKMLPAVEASGRITAQQIVLFTILLLPISLGPFFIGLSGWIFLGTAVALGLWFLRASIVAARSRSVSDSKKLMFVSVMYLPILFLVMVLNKIR